MKFFNPFFIITKPFHFLNKYPVLYRGTSFTLVNFGIFAALEGIVVIMLTSYLLFSRGFDVSGNIILISFMALLSIWGGARLLHIIALGSKFFEHPLTYLTQTGFYVQGGVAGAVVFSLYIAFVEEIPLVHFLDALAWAALLGQVFGRLGCFNYGCCFGKPSGNHTGVRYHNKDAKVLRVRPELRGVHLHPSQLYTALSHLCAFIVISLLIPLNLPSGSIGIFFGIYHGLSRILLEMLREDIYFNKKRNWITHHISCILIGLSGLYGLVNYFINPLFLTRPDMHSRPGIVTFFSYIFSHPAILAACLLTGLCVFIGYGIHGTTLGTFPFANKKQKSALRTRLQQKEEV